MNLTRRDFLKLCGSSSLTALLAACGVAPTPIPAPTLTPLPTSTPLPTVTPTLTNTPVPTSIVTPTGTPTATATPQYKEVLFVPDTLAATAAQSGNAVAVLARTSELMNNSNHLRAVETNFTGGIVLGDVQIGGWAPGGKRLHPSPNEYNWGYVDFILNYCLSRDIPINLSLPIVQFKPRVDLDWIKNIADPGDFLNAQITHVIPFRPPKRIFSKRFRKIFSSKLSF